MIKNSYIKLTNIKIKIYLNKKKNFFIYQLYLK